ncbi:MFS transporter [candidate division KSB1 bacterium]|nr:MFS transporter [candidate division KSB1 bacterium]
MNSGRSLTPTQQQIGRKRYLWFTSINAISYSCLGNSILILYAIKNGADDFLVGLVTSFFYLTMPFMFMGKKMVARLGAARTYSISWLFRNISASFMILTPFVSAKFGLPYGLLVLSLSSFGFFVFRSVGLTANTPVIGEITTRTTRGNFISRIWLHFNIFNLFTMIVLIRVLAMKSDLSYFQFIIAFGSIMGMIAAIFIYFVPESENPLLSGQQPIKIQWDFIRGNLKTQKLLIAWISVVIIDVLINPFSMVALKNGYGIADQDALLFALIQIFGGILAALINSLILDRVGPRPMLIIYVCGLISISFLWIIAPIKMFIIYPVLLFLILGMSYAGSMTTLSHYFLTIIPDHKRVGVNMIIFMVSGLSAGLSGTFLGGGLLNTLRRLGIEGLHVYKLYFSIILLVLLPLFFMVKRLERVSDWKIRDVLGVFLSFRDIRALFALQHLDKTLNIQQEFEGVERLRNVPSQLSENKLLSYLDSPRFTIRGKALATLGRFKFSSHAVKAIIHEVERGEFTTAYIAAEILGEHKIKEAIPILRESLDSEDIYLRGTSMLALAKLRDNQSTQRIKDIFSETMNPRLIIHGALAIVVIGDLDNLILLLNKSAQGEIPHQVREELLFSISELCGCDEEFYRFLKSFKENKELGLSTLKEIIRNYQMTSQINGSKISEYIDRLDAAQLCDCDAISPLLIQYAQDNSSPISGTIAHFLITTDPESLSLELVLCLLLVLAKFELAN